MVDMERIIKHFIGFLFLAVLWTGCESVNDSNDQDPVETGGTVTITGKVFDSSTGAGLKDAVVRIIDSTAEVAVLSGSDGTYSASVKLAKNKDLTIITLKAGYTADTTSIYGMIGQTVNVPDISLKTSGKGSSNSGNASSIYVLAQTVTAIGVKESGSPETSEITFQIMDSTGKAIDVTHAVDVSFSLGAKPGGGEFIYPSVVRTDASGQAKVNVTSGTKAGVVQLLARIVVGPKIIVSKPVSIAIHGGLPDQAHFAIAPKLLNIPGYNIFGSTDAISAYVGDKYGNPVVQGTSVYFTTTGGIIEGSAATGANGVGSVTLMSALPRPVHPTLGAGYAIITASTADEFNNTVSDQTVVLFSGVPMLDIAPTGGFDIANGGSQTFHYTLMDQNGNPLAGGTAINVAVEGEGVKSKGDLAITIPDTQSKSWTEFSFMVYDAVDTSNVVKPVNIKISASGPNGAAKLSIQGVSR